MMTIAELKERLIWCVSNSDFKTYQIERLIEEYEKENKQTLTNDFLLELIKGVKSELESMQKEIENIKGINGLNFESHAKRLNKIEEKLEPEPKQERFTFREYKELDTISKMYEVLDSKNELKFRALLQYVQAKDVCENLNQMEGGWK